MQLCRTRRRSIELLCCVFTGSRKHHLCTTRSSWTSPNSSTSTSASASESSTSLCTIPQNKLKLLRSSGFSSAQIAQLLERPMASSFPLCNLASKVDILGPDLIARYPALLHLAIPNLQRKLHFFSSLGLPLLQIAHLGRLLKYKLDTLQSRLSYLTSIGISSVDLRKIVRHYPYILSAHSEKCILPALLFFEHDRGLSRETLCKIIVSHPHIICSPIQKIAQKVEFFETLGLHPDSPRFYDVVGCLSSMTSDLVLKRIDWFVSCGLSREEVLTIVQREPKVFTYRLEVTGKKIDYLLNVMNRDIQEVLIFPRFLAMSLENRIKPRFSVVDRLVERGLLKRTTWGVSTILKMSNKDFQTRFVGKLCGEEPQSVA